LFQVERSQSKYKGKVTMSERHTELEGKEAVLRRELREAIEICNGTDARARLAADAEHRALQALRDAEGEVERLQSAQQRSERSAIDREAKAAANALRVGSPLPRAVFVTEPAHTASLASAKASRDALKSAHATLAAEHSSAKDNAVKADGAVHKLRDAVFLLILERNASIVIEAQREAWRLLDAFTAACAIAGNGKTHEIQKRVVDGVDLWRTAVADMGRPIDQKDFADYQAARAATHEPKWRDFANALMTDANAEFKEGHEL
jgi:hypothetical protein